LRERIEIAAEENHVKIGEAAALERGEQPRDLPVSAGFFARAAGQVQVDNQQSRS